MAQDLGDSRLNRELGTQAPLNLTVNSSSAAAEAAQYILTWITTGKYSPGDRLPAERVLAADLGYGREIIREALTVIEILGLIEIMPGSGAYVRQPNAGSDLLSDTLQWALLLTAGNYDDLLEIRSSLEVLALKLAARNIERAQRPMFALRKLRNALEAQEECLNNNDMSGFVAADARFHLELGMLSENAVLQNLLSTLRRMLEIWLENSVSSTDVMETAYHEHFELFHALESQDSELAVRLMNAHMASASDRLLSAHSGHEEPAKA